jgi:hypothetical protein
MENDNNKVDSIVPESDDRIGKGGIYKNRLISKEYSSSSQEKSDNESRINWHKISYMILLVTTIYLVYLTIAQGSELNQLQARLDQLETNIISSDIDSNLKEKDLKLEKHWSEIKKLWGIAYDRNAKSIKKIKTTLEYQKQDLTNIEKKLGRTNKSMDSLVSSSLATKLEVDDLISKYGNKPSSDIKARIFENEKAIEAIDAHRLIINRDIQQLKSQLSTNP